MMDVEAYQHTGDVRDVDLFNIYTLPSYSIDAISRKMVFQPHGCDSVGVPESDFMYCRKF